MDETMTHVEMVDNKFEAKVDKEDLIELMQEKLDLETFAKVFPKDR